jgi:2-keto-4-pentenoate hydratase/2-oxohepta-3-ene-1,7-dioic acid hydratase in catechol pathway
MMAGSSERSGSLYLRRGDVVETEIDRIGMLRNAIVFWEEAHCS